MIKTKKINGVEKGCMNMALSDLVDVSKNGSELVYSKQYFPA